MSDLNRKEKILLEEYKLCLQTAQSFEGPIWQTSSIIGLGTIGALLLIATKDGSVNIYVVLGAGLFVNVVAFFWYKMAKRLWSIQHTALLRSYHVELDLKKIYLTRYIKRRDVVAIPHCGYLRTHMWEKKCNEYKIPYKYKEEVEKIAKDYVRFGTQFYSKAILAIIALAWMVYIIWFVWLDNRIPLFSWLVKFASPWTKETNAAIAVLGILGFFIYYLHSIIRQKYVSDRLKDC